VQLLGSERVGPTSSVVLPDEAEPVIWGVGSGFKAYPDLVVGVGSRLAAIRAEARVHASDVARLAAYTGLAAAGPPEAALPVYLRDDVATPSRSAMPSQP
jgi:hypothetical protein